ncbi:protein kinase [Streptomyces sp. NBC_00322]|uniref:protein kinase domain-containing protein n=1 Tax=Streptomyces sp. NBC_00322 TaxID=2975712 RepID=UPI002E2AA6DD|nr:protein kinase [Streptomyces sp. NBC_00322]
MIPSDKQRLIADRYLLTDLIGRGGMGAVWRATDQLLQRTVAVKELPFGGDGEGSRRALREARAIARVSHPHVIDIYDLVEFEDRLWIVMELVEGPSLSRHLASVGPLSPSRAAEIGLQLLDALGAVHAAGALHRDVKPANVLLRGDGSVVLSDFGIAALADGESLTSTGELMGSLDYIAPERLHGKQAGPPSDLFSLGATLCVLVSGRSPFAQPTPAAVLHAVAYDEPDIPDCADPLGMVIERLLHKDPAERLSAADTVDALRSIGTQEPGTLKQTLRAPTLPPPPRRRRLRWAAVSLAALLLAGGAATALVMNRPSAHHAASAPAHATRPTPPDAVMQAPDSGNRYWVFSGSQYAEIEVADGGHADKQVTKPHPLSDWSSLAGFSRVDAVMQAPDSRNLYWVFSGSQYAEIEVADGGHTDKQVTKPHPLSDWSSLAGFSRVDAVMQAPDSRNRYWVFSGNRYAEIEVADGGHTDKQVTKPHPLSDWSSLAGFSRVDAVMQAPDSRNRYWVFSGNRYAEIEVANGGHTDKQVTKPHPLSDWKSSFP